MIQIETNKNIIYTTVTDTLDTHNIEKQFEVINQLLQQYEKVRWYYEMVDFKGWNITSFAKDAAASLKKTARFEKIAMVGEKKWQDLMAQVSKALTPADVKYFDVDEKEAARKWIEA